MLVLEQQLQPLFLDVNGTGRITGTTTLTGNVGIGGASGTETLLVSGTGRITGNLDVSGDLTVTGNFNFSEVIQNITTVNNEVIISTQLDISNQGTGPALKSVSVWCRRRPRRGSI